MTTAMRMSAVGALSLMLYLIQVSWTRALPRQESKASTPKSPPVSQVTVPSRPSAPLYKGEQGKQQSEIEFTPATRTVTIKLQVDDPNGYFLPNLRRENFAVYEDGVRQKNVTVEVEHSPISVALLMEFGGRYHELNEALGLEVTHIASQLLDVLGRDDKIAIFKYGDKLEALVDFTQGHDPIDGAFLQLGAPGFSEVNFYDALLETLNRMREINGRNAIVVISSGLDTFSKTAYQQVLQAARDDATRIYTWAQSPSSFDLERNLQEKAWSILSSGAHVSDFNKRANAIQALGLISQDPAAEELAENALRDKDPNVRAAAAKALGGMGSAGSIPKLQDLLSDKDISVILAAAHALVQLKDRTGYDAYYSVLEGEIKGGHGLFTEEMREMKSPERAIKFAFDQGIGFIPYTGYGKEVLRAWKNRSTAPTRAAAARALADDPDPRSGRALAKAVSEKDWVVRAAALEAIAKRGDAALLADIEPAMSDKKDVVRYSAAAAVLQLVRITQRNAHIPREVSR